MMVELPTIEFEGRTVIPKKGVYRCPFKCGDPGYAAKTWKTETGFRKHMGTCPKSPSALKRQGEIDEKRSLENEQRRAEALGKVTQKIGDEVCWVQEIIVKDTHEQWGNRSVKVRYEQVKRFEARQGKIESIDCIGTNVYFNHYALGIRPWTICNSLGEAQSRAAEMEKSWNEWCDQAAACR
jgi:hypothetical protein